MAEVTTSAVGKNDIINSSSSTTMRQTSDNERGTIFGNRSGQPKDEEEEQWKSTSSPTKRNMMHKRQELENRILEMVSGGSVKLDLDQDEEQEVREQVQEEIEDQQQDAESRNQHHPDEGGTTQQTRRDSAAKDALLQEMSAPIINTPGSPLNLKPPPHRQNVKASPNLLHLSDKDPDQQQNLTKPSRWRSLDICLDHPRGELPQQRRASLDRASSRFGRQRQWQRDLSLSTRNDVQSTVQDKIQIQELQKKVSSLLHDLHETIERETDLEEKVLSLTNENDLLKEQVLQLQKQLNSKSSSSSSNEGTETSSTSVESSSQDPLFPDSDSSRKDKESSSATPEGEPEAVQDPSPEQEVANELVQATDAKQAAEVPQEQPPKASEPIVVEAVPPMTPERPEVQKEEPERHGVPEIQVDWTPPARPSRAAHGHDHHPVAAGAPPHYHQSAMAHTPVPQERGFYIDTCDNSTLSYSLYKGMAEIYDGTVDTGMEGEAPHHQQPPHGDGAAGHHQQREGSNNEDDNHDWEFLTERVSL